MPTRRLRTQILLEPEQHQELTEIAHAEQRSLSDVVREMLQTQLSLRHHHANLTKRRRLEALEQIRKRRQEILDRRGGKPLEIDAVESINQLRDERDGEIFTSIFNHRD